MDQAFRLIVLRRLDNRDEGLPDDSPRALELHLRRKEALHAIFVGAPLEVVEWGKTDDTAPHEDVYLDVVWKIAAPLIASAVVPGVKWLGEKLAEKGFDIGFAAAVKWVVSKFREPQEEEKVQAVTIVIPKNHDFRITVYPPDKGGRIDIQFEAKRLAYDYVADKELIP